MIDFLASLLEAFLTFLVSAAQILFYSLGLGCVLAVGFLLIRETILDRRRDKTRACRVCGCTDDRACPGGCWWAAEDLCSACVGAPRRSTLEVIR
jgi:hypothetical protein